MIDFGCGQRYLRQVVLICMRKVAKEVGWGGVDPVSVPACKFLASFDGI